LATLGEAWQEAPSATKSLSAYNDIQW